MDRLIKVVIGVGVVAILGIPAFGVAIFLHAGLDDGKVRTVEKYELVAVKTKASMEGEISGTFILFLGGISGTMGENEYCVFYYKNNDGGIRYQKCPLEQVTIYERKVEKPNVAIGVCWVTRHGRRTRVVESYNFYVPPNSVTRVMQFDLP